MTVNRGAVITGSRNLDNLVSIKETPYPTLEDDMIIVKTVAYAVNPTDWKHILPESFVSHLTTNIFKKFAFGIYPLECLFGYVGSNVGYYFGKTGTYFSQRGNVVGSDVSGIVEEVGKKVTNFKKGDVVAASLHGGINKNGGFADHVKVSPNGAIKLSSLSLSETPLEPGKYPGSQINSFEAAAALPVGLKTAGMSFHYNLGIPPRKEENEDDYLLIWGGATATGMLAIQVAKLVYGIKVITTASKRHHDALKQLGADKTFDYNDSDVIEQLKRAGGNRIKYALDCVSSAQTFQSVYDATEGAEYAHIDNLLFLDEKSIKTKKGRKVKFAHTDGYIIDGRVHFGAKASPEMMEAFSDFWNSHLPSILGKIKTAPLEVLPRGLKSANEGLKLLVENKVNGRKVVFRNDHEL
ncbi:hypothetical protein PGUG_05125 [Meyerozyma guilliermondii ATCC 6260]|uniref:Enoyl reductase (ER) domain-containing protein n=1 Tax=Meyerozyma guilliermondii (strain ATCC 6260 / CBS 566 / DSM 6381 / JCM 1539 / NBRC 10279 / NRRL Y-324) TaxID=294746 RepID=A5DPC4_PICGU|nr:uncharacterized protein PGUG_05125 [Meyerozyma guilliermondii ATCC 6260]EDK41027.2 hypothetical protein PGUG_05125 [Meyerozyma guilliermondii ATCC 6260]